MDWPTEDYTHMYSDVFVAPEMDGGGVYVLDEANRASDPIRARRRGPVPMRPVDRDGYPVPDGVGLETGYGVARGLPKEGFGSHVGFRGLTSDRSQRRMIDWTGWDERPQHYRPSASNEHAHLIINPNLRPPMGGVGFDNLAYPVPLNSHAIDMIDRFGNPKAPAPGPAPLSAQALQVANVVLLFVIVVLLATWLAVSCSRASADRIERMVRDAVQAMGARPAV
jgi:hypothetical protein